MNKLEFKYDKDKRIKLREFLRFDLNLSGRFIRTVGNEGKIKVNGEKVNLKFILECGDKIEIYLDKKESQNIEPQPMNIDIVYEDEDILVVNKTPGIVVHPTKSHPKGTLANGVLHYFKSKGKDCIVRLVSRLDMDTSGLIIIAKNQFSHMTLARDMELLKKKYKALVHGCINKDEGTIDLPIYRPGEGSIKRVVDSRGQKSITHYRVIERFENATLVELLLETGRTHQIRVHLSYLGHPLFGDSLYGEEFSDSQFIKRQALHAHELSFPHPKDGHNVNLTCDLPKDMKSLIHKLRANN